MLLTWCTVGGEDLHLHERVTAAFTAWEEAAPCPSWTHADQGECTAEQASDLAFFADDPADELEEGVISVSFYSENGVTLILNDMPFSSDADVDAGTCDVANLDLLLRHELGHALGLEHTCDSEAACTSAADADAVMYWSAGGCDARQPNESDAALLRAEHGPAPVPLGGPVIAGPAPAELCFSLPASVGPTATWDFGDGTTGTGGEVCHTWTEDGSFPVSVSLAYACGDTETLAYASVQVLTPSTPDEDAKETGCHTGGSDAALLPGLLAAALLGAARRKR